MLAIVGRHAHREGPLLPILHEVQATYGHVPREAIPVIAKALNISRAEVHGVITFYHDFRTEPAGRVLKICRAESCQAMGALALIDRVCARSTWPGRDARRGVRSSRSIASATARRARAMVNGRLHGRLDAGKLDAVLAGLWHDCGLRPARRRRARSAPTRRRAPLRGEARGVEVAHHPQRLARHVLGRAPGRGGRRGARRLRPGPRRGRRLGAGAILPARSIRSASAWSRRARISRIRNG